MSGQGACEAGRTDGSGGEKNPSGKGGMQVFLVRKAVCFSISFFFQVSGQGACEAGGTDGSGGEKNPSGKGGMQVFLVRKAVCFSISFFSGVWPRCL